MTATPETTLAPAPAQVRPRNTPLLALLSAAGLGVTGYLTYVRLTHAALLCSAGGDCETVQASPYAAIGGVPVALMGLLLYAAMLVLSLTAWRGPASVMAWGALGIFGLSLTATLYSGYLTYIELFVLRAFCVWCVTSATIVTASCGISAWTLLRPPVGVPE